MVLRSCTIYQSRMFTKSSLLFMYIRKTGNVKYIVNYIVLYFLFVLNKCHWDYNYRVASETAVHPLFNEWRFRLYVINFVYANSFERKTLSMLLYLFAVCFPLKGLRGTLTFYTLIKTETRVSVWVLVKMLIFAACLFLQWQTTRDIRYILFPLSL